MFNNPNSEILAASELAVKGAKKELNRTLDYSINSLNDLEAFIQHVRSHFLTLKNQGKLTEQTIQRASVSVGGYLGEVIRRKYGGSWIAKNTVMKTLIINDQEFSPILYAFQRLAKDLDYSLDSYLSEINQKLPPGEKIEHEPPVSETPKKATNSLTGNRSLIIGGVIGITVLCFIGILGIIVYSNIKATNEFESKLNTFLVQADKLDLMTEQGVSYQEFRTQLIEVKSTYASIDYWPSRYQDEKLAFDKAIEGWDLTLDVWEYSVNDPNIDFDTYVAGYISGSVIDRWSEYAGIELTTGRGLTVNDWIGGLMGRASTYLASGKAGIK